MVEAGTGVGKSFAYLVPAIQAALADKDCRVVVSTHTISLQEQLLRKDIPFLQTVMPARVPGRPGQGPGNYLSLRRLRVAQQRLLTLPPDRTAADQLVQIGRWSRQTPDGSRSDLPFPPLPAVWDLVESDNGNCLGRKCPDHAECFYFKARAGSTGRTSWSSTTPCSSATWPCAGRGRLPARLPGRHLRRGPHPGRRGRRPPRPAGEPGRASSTCSTSCSPRGSTSGLLASYGDDEAIAQLEHARQAAERFFQSVRAWQDRQGPRAPAGSASRASSRTCCPRS